MQWQKTIILIPINNKTQKLPYLHNINVLVIIQLFQIKKLLYKKHFKLKQLMNLINAEANLGTPLLFLGSERVCTATASEQPTGHSGLTSKAEEEE